MTKTTSAARVLVVDDHPMIRRGINSLLSHETDLCICGEAESIGEAFQRVKELNPDLVIIDISLKDGNGLELIKQLSSEYASLKMLVHSMYDDMIYAERALQAGALGYLNKQSSHTDLVNAVRTVLSGRTYLSQEMTDRVITGRLLGTFEYGKDPIASLSDRELEVFQMIGKGLSTKEIAETLFLSVNTVDTYRDKLKKKLNLSSGTKLNRHAIQWMLENHG